MNDLLALTGATREMLAPRSDVRRLLIEMLRASRTAPAPQLSPRAIGGLVLDLRSALTWNSVRSPVAPTLMWADPSEQDLLHSSKKWAAPSPVSTEQLSSVAARYLRLGFHNRLFEYYLLLGLMCDARAQHLQAMFRRRRQEEPWVDFLYGYFRDDMAAVVRWQPWIERGAAVVRWIATPLVLASAYLYFPQITWAVVWASALWLLHVTVHLIRVPFKRRARRRRHAQYEPIVQTAEAAREIYKALRSDVFNPSQVQDDLRRNGANGFPVPPAVFAILARAVTRDPAVFVVRTRPEVDRSGRAALLD